MKLGIYIPTYKRPGRLQAVATNIEQTTRSPFVLYWGCEPEDAESIIAAKATGHKVILNKGAQGYSDTIQTIYEAAKEPVLFHANDDFEFMEGWDEAPMLYLAEHPEVMVLGAHDGTPTPSYSTISFIRREYIKKLSGVVDTPNRVFYPYKHNYVDTELTQTAQARGVWAKIETPCIKHHRIGGDETYKKNDATSPEDAKVFASREHLWKSISREDIMPRKPLTDEERKARSDAMKARWAVKKTDNRPVVESTQSSSVVARALESTASIRETIVALSRQNPDMIELTQAVDALNEAAARMGQAEGLLKK